MGRRQPRHLHIEFSFVNGEGAFHDTVRNRAGHTAAVFASLHHGNDNIARFIERRITGEPGNRVLMSAIRRLRRAGLPRHDHVFQSGARTGAAILVHHFPKSLSHDVHLIVGKIVAEIGPDARRDRSRFAMLIQGGRAILVQDAVD